MYYKLNEYFDTASPEDKPKEACGIFGIINHKEAANITYLGLHALQHRGQESAGIATSDNGKFKIHKEMGLVVDVFGPEKLSALTGDIAIGHVRYSTAGESELKNAQPFNVEYQFGSLAIAHNGNLVNAIELRKELEASGSIFQSTMDTEVIIHLLAHSKEKKERNIVARLKDILPRLKGAYSLVFLTETSLVAVRDPNGFRPLVLGKLGESYVVASETCAFDLIGAQLIRHLEPGEILEIHHGDNIITKDFIPLKQKIEPTPCVFEQIYFARPNSYIEGTYVYKIRKQLGSVLAKEQPSNGDVVIGVPDSGMIAAHGYAATSGIPLELGLIRSHYVGRTFIEPKQEIRHFGVKLKLSPVREVLENKKVIVVDDSIVRGTTSKKIVLMLKSAGAKEVHVRISSPPTLGPCFYGIDTPKRSELIASQKTIDQIREFIGADSLGYLSLSGLRHAVNESHYHHCDACFSNQYPIPVE